MNRYNIGDVLHYKSSFYITIPGTPKLVGMIVSIVPTIKVKWCGIEAPQTITAQDISKYNIQRVKHENRTPNDV